MSPSPRDQSYDALFDDPDAGEEPADPTPAPPNSAAEHEAPKTGPLDLSTIAEQSEPAALPLVSPPAPSGPISEDHAPLAASSVPGWDHARPETDKAGRAVDTGRLYRSAGAEGPATLTAIPALPLRAESLQPSLEAAAAPERAPSTTTTPASGDVVPETAPSTPLGLTYLGVVVVVGVVTFVAALGEALLTDQIGWFTGLALLASSTYAAIRVRLVDWSAAVVTPPLAFFVSALIAGQLTLGKDGSLISREAFMLFKTLALAAPWVIGATVVAAVIVVVRRRRQQSTH